MTAQPSPSPLIDPFGRRISYVRLSVTDRCDLRCVYCMAEDMTFLPKRDLLSLEELDRLASTLISLGVERIRLTGGEPLVRRGVMTLVESLSRHLRTGALKELTLTTNGTQLARFADDLARHGVRRINVSLDSLDPGRFETISRWGKLDQVMEGIEAAKAAGLKIKINMVALDGLNGDEIPAMLDWCIAEGFDLTLIETMPMGEIDEDRTDRYLSLQTVRARIEDRFALSPSAHRTGGPARYFDIGGTPTKLGLITPMSHIFCEACNRVRLTCTGTMFMCLGQEDRIELRDALRASESDEVLIQAIRTGIEGKPKGHDFVIGRGLKPAVPRHMNVTGG